MGQRIDKRARISLADTTAVIAFSQPKLAAEEQDDGIRVHGTFLLNEVDGSPNPGGPIDEFEVDIFIPRSFPKHEPKVIEIGGRIPRVNDRHVGKDGDCCVCVWEHWLASTNDVSLAGYFSGPLHSFFLSQYVFEKTGKWPFDDWAHGLDGLREAYAELLGITNKVHDIVYHLRLLSQDWPKGHWLCPCGSGKILRHCHREQLMDMHTKRPPRLARQMLRRLQPILPKDFRHKPHA